jgi:hypothetical protein
MNHTADLYSGLNQEVEYRSGFVMFSDAIYIQDDSDSETEKIVMIDDDDYTISVDVDIDECPVCYETYEPMYGSTCGHSVCNKCMVNMNEKGLHNCPLCRSDRFKYPIALACNRNYVIV